MTETVGVFTFLVSSALLAALVVMLARAERTESQRELHKILREIRKGEQTWKWSETTTTKPSNRSVKQSLPPDAEGE